MQAMTDTQIIKDPTRSKARTGSKKAGRPARKSTINLKLLLSTAALAATLDGWALLAARDQSLAAGTQTTVTEAPLSNPAADPTGGTGWGGYLPERPPIPTVVPAPAAGSAGPLLAPGGARSATPANRAAPAAPAPVPPKVARPALRKVSPPPVAVTRSSR
jgi:hypothetical protein